MRVPDVNVLVGALRDDGGSHHVCSNWLSYAVNDSELLGLSGSVLSGFVRIATNPRVFPVPTPLPVALDQIDELLRHPGVDLIGPGPRHWEIFSRLCRGADARGNLVADASHAAVAIEHGATWVTLDRDFARFPGLRWEVPAHA